MELSYSSGCARRSASEALLEAAELDPEFNPALRNLALEMSKRGRYDEARDICSEIKRPIVPAAIYGVFRLLLAGLVPVTLWGVLGLALVTIPIVGIGVMIRAIVLELRGKRPRYTAGVADLRDIPTKQKPFRPFRTEFPNDSSKD